MLLASMTAARAQMLRGRITDSRGEPMPAASVYIPELRQGTTSNSEGYYEISLPPGNYTVTYQFLGYVPVTRSFAISGESMTANITLTEQLFEIPPVRVSASGRDPAYFIMRKAIGMAPFHLNQVRRYRAEVYIRGGGSIDKLPALLKRQMKTEANSTELQEGKYYFTESVNEITFRAPDRYVHRVISSNSSEEMNQGQASPMDFIEASFYQPVLADIAISPLAPNAFSHYSFTFLGSTSQGDYVIDRIRVTPRRKSQQLFTGEIFIVEDLWAIHSLDLTNDNMAGRIRVRQLYTPVEEGIWMPVSHEFKVDISIMGVKARASYTSAVKYLEVEPDRKLPRPPSYSGMSTDRTPVQAGEPKTPAQREIEAILAKDDISARDMSRLARLNEKNTRNTQEKPPLEIENKTTVIIEEDATGKDSAYWAEVRPIPLTREETASLATAPVAGGTLARRDTSEIRITIGSGSGRQRKSQAGRLVRDVAGGKRWQLSKNAFLEFDGLADLGSFSYNTVDGFIAGTGMDLSLKTGKAGRFTFAPSVKYAFSREQFMWNITANMLYDPMRAGNLFLRTGHQSDEFSPAGINPVVNMVSSLFFRENLMKLYDSRYIIAGHRSDLSNGLTLSVSGMYGERKTLENNSDFSFFRKDYPWSENIPDNPYTSGSTGGYEPEPPVSHNHLSLNSSLSWTPRQRYRLSEGARVSAGSDYPTFTIAWKHGYNSDETLSGAFDLISGEINRTSRFGPLNEFRWRIRGGKFFNEKNIRLQDMYFFNTQSSPVLINNYEDAFYLKHYYSMSTRKGFAEGHIRYTSPMLLVKRLPGLSNTLIRENVSLAMLWTPEAGYYCEAGYALSEVFLIGTAGVCAGFGEKGFESVGIRVILRLE